MFERFTERARQVVVLAQEESRGLRHNYIGTEHILLGLIREREGIAAQVLESLGVTHDGAREQVLSFVEMGDEELTGQIPFTPRAKKALELALREALALRHNYIGTEHLLLGLIKDKASVAVRTLLELQVTPAQIRDEVIRVVASAPRPMPELERSLRLPSVRELAPAFAELAPEIRRKLGREPDAGDLLIVLASMYGVGDLDEVQAAVERRRGEEQSRADDALGEARRRLGL